MKDLELGLASIVMPCYNGVDYIMRSFKSILSQTYPYIQLIFVDDGSMDNSLSVAESFRKEFDKKKYELIIISQDNKGVAAACKLGIEYATGEYLSFLDVDDALLPYSIEKKVHILKLYPECNIVKTNGYRINENGIRSLISDKFDSGFIANSFSLYLLGEMDNFAGTYMVRNEVIKDFYENKIFLESRYGQNLQIVLPASFYGTHYYINEPQMLYFIHSDSHSNTDELFRLIELNNEYYKIRSFILDQIIPSETQLKSKLRKIYLSNVINIICCFPECPETKLYFNKYYAILSSEYRTSFEFRMYHARYNNNLFLFYLYRILNFITTRK